MKLNNLKASLLAVVFAMGLNTTAQSMEQQPQIELRAPSRVIGGMGGVHHASTPQACDDGLFETRPSDCESGRRGRVVIEETVTDRIKFVETRRDDRCGDAASLSIQAIIAANAKDFYSCNDWVRVQAQKTLFGYLKSGREDAVLAAGGAIAQIIIESNRPQPKPVPQPKPNTVHQVLKSEYDLNIDTCLLRSIVAKMFGGSKSEDHSKNPYTNALDVLNKAGIKMSLTATGVFNVTVDPCNTACANLCGPEKADCGCKGEDHESGYTHEDKDDCKCHDKGKPKGLTEADGKGIDLIIENLGRFSHCEPAKLTLTSLCEIATQVQQAKIKNLFSQHCAR